MPQSLQLNARSLYHNVMKNLRLIQVGYSSIYLYNGFYA